MRNKFLAGIGNLFGDFGRARNAVNTYERLNALSDASLARQGLSRADLPAEAFKRSFRA